MPQKIRMRSSRRRGVPTKMKRVIKNFIDTINDKEQLEKIMEATGISESRKDAKPIRCCCCYRQMVHSDESTERTVSGKNAAHMGPGMYACHECSQDLDENGLFPEERH